MRVSKYIKIDPNVLIEYVYDDGNLIGESYKIGVNIRNKNLNYIAVDTSGTLNTSTNTLFPIDLVTNKYGIFDINTYSFLQENDYASGFPLRHDIVNIYLPINYTFGEHLGIYLRAYAFNSKQTATCDLANFFFDITNIDQSGELSYVNPPLYFQEKLWGKKISLKIPSLFAVSGQTVNGAIKPNSINYNLTNGIGLDTNSPLFIDFQFISNISVVNSIKTYSLVNKNTITIPQSPEFEKVGVKIEESANGDFFEIYAVYNDTIGDFNEFINRSVYLGNRYYVQYTITMYEQNIRGKSLTVIVNSDFLSKVEYRPIIKYSTTTAIIDVEMDLIDAVDNTQIVRRASYGMLQDQVSKYSLRLMKINLANAHKPKIYNLKNTNTYTPTKTGVNSGGNVTIEQVSVSYPVLVDRYNVVAKSDSVSFGKDTFFGIGKIAVILYPFDNILKIIIASQVADGKIEYMDMTNMGEIKLTIKNTATSVDTPLYTESDSVNLSTGFLAFKIPSGKFSDIRKMYESGVNVFYITSTQQTTTSVVYTGLYKIYDSLDNVANLNQQNLSTEASSIPVMPSIIPDSVSSASNTAVVTRKAVTTIATASMVLGTASGI